MTRLWARFVFVPTKLPAERIAGRLLSLTDYGDKVELDRYPNKNNGLSRRRILPKLKSTKSKLHQLTYLYPAGALLLAGWGALAWGISSWVTP